MTLLLGGLLMVLALGGVIFAFKGPKPNDSLRVQDVALASAIPGELSAKE